MAVYVVLCCSGLSCRQSEHAIFDRPRLPPHFVETAGSFIFTDRNAGSG